MKAPHTSLLRFLSFNNKRLASSIYRVDKANHDISPIFSRCTRHSKSNSYCTLTKIVCYLVEIDHIVLFIDHPTTCDFAEIISHKEFGIVHSVLHQTKVLYLRRDQQHVLLEKLCRTFEYQFGIDCSLFLICLMFQPFDLLL